MAAKRPAGPHTRPPAVRIVCLDRQKELFRQTAAIFRSRKDVRVEFESSLERVLDRVEEDVCDVLIASSAIVRGGRAVWPEFVEALTAKSPWSQVIFLIKPRELSLASRVLKAGSYHYAKLPVSDEELRLLIEAALSNRPNVDPQCRAVRSARAVGFEDMVGVSPGMKSVYRLIRQAAATDIPVLLTGETGTGKDLAARAIHQLSERSAHAGAAVRPAPRTGGSRGPPGSARRGSLRAGSCWSR